MTADADSEYLWFDQRTSNDEIRDKIEKHAKTVRRLHVLSQTFLMAKGLSGFELPNLTELLVESLYSFDSPSDWSFLHRLKSLKTFVAGTTYANDAILAGLADAPWWVNLTQLELRFLDLGKTTKWNKLWDKRKMSLEILCLHFLSSEQACQILNAELKNLRYFIPGVENGSSFLQRLNESDLPSLEDLELRHADIPDDEVRSFINEEHPNLPNLARIGKDFFSDQRIDYCDWNGAVVDWGYEQLSDADVQRQIFNKTKYTVLSSNSELEGRSSQSWLRPLQRV